MNDRLLGIIIPRLAASDELSEHAAVVVIKIKFINIFFVIVLPSRPRPHIYLRVLIGSDPTQEQHLHAAACLLHSRHHSQHLQIHGRLYADTAATRYTPVNVANYKPASRL